MTGDVGTAEEDLEYCRSVETYLCRKNDGHLIRIVGPAFEHVSAWAAKGVPLKVAFRGIDRYFERYYSKGTRRRPVRVEFCEADVLDVFDEWRRAVGVADVEPGEESTGEQSGPVDSHAPGHRKSLPAHLDRTISRLTAAASRIEGPLADVIAGFIVSLDALRPSVTRARGEAREVLLRQLADLDGELMQAVRASLEPSDVAEIAAEADVELAPFRYRMPSAAFERAREACVVRLVRERAGLPTLSLG